MFTSFAPIILLAAPNCQSPQQALATMLDYQQADQYDLEAAATCVKPQAGDAERRTVKHFKQVLDATGEYVELQSVPADSKYKNANGQHIYQLSPRLPELRLSLQGGQWYLSQKTRQKLPELYQDTFLVDPDTFEASIPTSLRSKILGMKMWQWLGILLLTLAGILARIIFAWVLNLQIRIFMRSTKIRFNRESLQDVSRPLATIITAGFLGLLLPLLVLPIRFSQIAGLALRFVAVLSAVWTAYRLVDLFTNWLAQRASGTQTKLDDQLVPLIRRSMHIFVVAIGIIFILQNLNIDVAGLVAGLGIGGLAFALAAKDTVANLFGSATIFVDRPFQIGDWISTEGVEGVIESVGFRSTRVRTFYNSLVTVPNSTIANAVIDNLGARSFRRCKMSLGLIYSTPPTSIEAFVASIRELLENHPDTRKDAIHVYFNGMGDFSLNILLYFFFEVDSWEDELRGKQDVLLKILTLAKELEVDFAFPTQSLFVEDIKQNHGFETQSAPSGTPQ